MMNMYSAFGTSQDLEVNGVTLDFGVCKFKVRRSGGGNRAFQVSLSSKLRPHRRAVEAGTMDESVAQRIYMDVFFETVVISWENVTDRNGSVLPYNRENFTRVMTDLPDLWEALRRECDNMRNFQMEQAEAEGEALGKS